MFPGFDPQALLAQAQAMQQQIVDTQAALAVERVEGSAGGGLVVAVMSGTGELVEMRIDPGVLDPADPETVSDLVVAAVRDAQQEVNRLSAQRLGGITQGLGGFGGDLTAGLAMHDPDETTGDFSGEAESAGREQRRPQREEPVEFDFSRLLEPPSSG